ncbi:MAG: alkyl sulfatase dimerization domain-containing protein [Acidimicrobiia bacterium]|jgi:alkyl sulfatase BDS1-like metallo-beta-lactamase superfamily hydrolase
MANDATPTTVDAHRALLADPLLDWSDQRDFEAAHRGFVAALDPPVIPGDGDQVAWDLQQYGFLADATAPLTVNPSLWRQARLNMVHGLFRIHERISQVRGYDLSVMSIIEGDTGWIVVDPLISQETARASLRLVNEHLGERPVVAVIYSHSHVDHFGGVEGVTTLADVHAGKTRILAPEGFLLAAVSENVIAGFAMNRRAIYMYGAALEKSPTGHVDAGLGKTTSSGNVSVIAPTDVISETGTTMVIDGVEIEFQLTPGTEAPAEMNFYFPQLRALCMAENCSRNLHNVYTLRGAQVRDASAWARYMDESIVRYIDRTDLVFTSHHWPVWGTADCLEYLEKQRDMYQYLHDQTLRLANQGETMLEIAEQVELPPSLAKEWYSRGYYGTVNHDVKAVYQRYLGFFDGNPAHLHPHPPVEAARRYVEYMGGADAVLARARADYERGDYRWVAEVVNHVVFADPDNADARSLQADALEQMGYQAESGPWRNFFLMGARELRTGEIVAPEVKLGSGIVRNMPLSLILDALAVRLNGPRAGDTELRFNLVDTHDGTRYAVWLQNAVLHHRLDDAFADPDLAISAEHDVMAAIIFGLLPLADAAASGMATAEGDLGAIGRLQDLLDRLDPAFPIVTP